MKNLFDIQGQVVVITGGTGVLGRWNSWERRRGDVPEDGCDESGGGGAEPARRVVGLR